MNGLKQRGTLATVYGSEGRQGFNFGTFGAPVIPNSTTTRSKELRLRQKSQLRQSKVTLLWIETHVIEEQNIVHDGQKMLYFQNIIGMCSHQSPPQQTPVHSCNFPN